MYFSPPILNTEYGIFVPKQNSLQFKHPKDLKGYAFAVFGPSNTSVSLNKLKEQVNDISVDITPDDEAAFKKVNIARVDAVYSNRDVGYAMIARLGLKNVRYAGPHKQLKYYIGYSKEFTSHETVKKLNDSFIKLHQEGKIQKS